MGAREKTLGATRLLHAAFLTTVLVFLLVARLAGPPERPVAPEIALAIAAVACADVVIGFTLRRRFLQRATDALTSDGEASALAAWRFANLYSFAHAETVVLFGLVLKFLGASWRIAGPFFFVGFALLLWWAPRLELPLSAGAPAAPPPPVR